MLTPRTTRSRLRVWLPGSRTVPALMSASKTSSSVGSSAAASFRSSTWVGNSSRCKMLTPRLFRSNWSYIVSLQRCGRPFRTMSRSVLTHLGSHHLTNRVYQHFFGFWRLTGSQHSCRHRASLCEELGGLHACNLPKQVRRGTTSETVFQSSSCASKESLERCS